MHIDQEEDKQMIWSIVHDMYEQACQYKQKAAHNIKRIADLDCLPTTQDDVKTALEKSLMEQPPWQTADLMFQACQFQSAKFLKHILSKHI